MPQTIERIDGYAQHYFSQLITWFTFFSTVNWAVLGWLSVSLSVNKGANTDLISVVAGAFAIKNFLGILMCLFVMSYFIKTSKRLDTLEDEENKKVFPIDLALATCIGMIVAIIVVMCIWLYIWSNY